MVKIGVIGTGNIGKRHIQSIAELKDIELFCHDAFEKSLNSVNDFIKDNSLSFKLLPRSTCTDKADCKVSGYSEEIS